MRGSRWNASVNETLVLMLRRFSFFYWRVNCSNLHCFFVSHHGWLCIKKFTIFFFVSSMAMHFASHVRVLFYSIVPWTLFTIIITLIFFLAFFEKGKASFLSPKKNIYYNYDSYFPQNATFQWALMFQKQKENNWRTQKQQTKVTQKT